MFSIEGHEPLYVFYNVAFQRVMRILRTEEKRRIQEAHEKGEERQRYPFVVANAQVAAEFVVYDLISRLEQSSRKKIQILREDGSRLTIPSSLLVPVWYEPYGETKYAEARKLEAKRRGTDFPVRFGMASLDVDYWVSPFLEEQCFTERPLRMLDLTKNIEKSLPIVNWGIGCINLKQHHHFLEGITALKTAVEALSRIPCEPPASMLRFAEFNSERNFGFMKMLAPFDGCPIIVPEEWLAELIAGSDKKPDASQSDTSSESKYDQVLGILLAEDVIKKPLIKSKAAEMYGISGREVDRIWDDIAEDRPELELNKPGPKSRRRATN